MSFLDGILEKQDPSERVRQALVADLELRRKDERLATRFRGYAYHGSAALILEHGRFFDGRTVPEAYEGLRGMPQGCFVNALLACEKDPSLRYFEGVYTTGFGRPTAHAWCVAPDGGVVEVTMPTLPEELAHARMARTFMPVLPPKHWGYYGVEFRPELVRDHFKTYPLPMFDRGYSEMAEHHTNGDGDLYAEDHDFPILKVPYDINRTELP